MKRQSIINISDYYLTRAEEDRKAGELLAEAGLYNQAIYFSSQYMEKFIKSEISKLISIENKYTHDLVNKHSIKDLMILLIEISVADKLIREQLSSQVREILGKINYDKLHNNLRYPYYNPRTKEFVATIYTEKDYEEIVNVSFKKLKDYVSQLYRF